LTDDEKCVLAVLEALGRWFMEGDEGALTSLRSDEPGEMVSVLFGLLLATIESACESTGQDPVEYLQELSRSLQVEIGNDNE
jgi:hypothetical protein